MESYSSSVVVKDYFCHSCSSNFKRKFDQLKDAIPLCPSCCSDFVEQISSNKIANSKGILLEHNLSRKTIKPYDRSNTWNNKRQASVNPFEKKPEVTNNSVFPAPKNYLKNSQRYKHPFENETNIDEICNENIYAYPSQPNFDFQEDNKYSETNKNISNMHLFSKTNYQRGTTNWGKKESFKSNAMNNKKNYPPRISTQQELLLYERNFNRKNNRGFYHPTNRQNNHDNENSEGILLANNPQNFESKRTIMSNIHPDNNFIQNLNIENRNNSNLNRHSNRLFFLNNPMLSGNNQNPTSMRNLRNPFHRLGMNNHPNNDINVNENSGRFY